MTDVRFRALFDHSSDPHLIFGSQGITDCNAATVAILGAQSRDEVLSLHPAALSPTHQPDGQTSIAKAREMDQIARDRGFHRFEWWHQRIDGVTFPVLVTINPIVAEGADLMVVVWHDLRETKQRESELRSANEKLRTANERLERDLEAAAEVQRGFLPHDPPGISGLEFAYRYEPARMVGGDFLGFTEFGPEQIFVYQIDVTGHGVPAALLAVTIAHLLSAESAHGGMPIEEGPARVLTALNRRFAGHPREVRMFTMVAAALDARTGALRLAAAGHPAPCVVRADHRVDQIGGPRGRPVGVAQDSTYAEESLFLAPGDRLVFASDGVLEARDAHRQTLGAARWAELLHQSAGLPLGASLDAALRAVRAHRQRHEDDLSVLALGREPKSRGTGPMETAREP